MNKVLKKMFLLVLSFSLVCIPIKSYSLNTLNYKEMINYLPLYDGKPNYVINNNRPFFVDTENYKVYKKYSKLDKLKRVGRCEVVTGKEYIPKEKRKSINSVTPTGWKQKKYSHIKGKYLYHRCHLIGFQIAGDNADKRNIMTGTQSFNVSGMLPYENKIIRYIKNTNNHVKYRVTPIFVGNDLVSLGVFMEAKSIEDNKLKFNVFCYNVQPGIHINYKTGDAIKVDPFIGIKTFTIDLFKGGRYYG